MNASAQPLLLSAPSKLSSTWFPDGQRATATAIASISNSLGIGFAYLIGPAM